MQLRTSRPGPSLLGTCWANSTLHVWQTDSGSCSRKPLKHPEHKVTTYGDPLFSAQNMAAAALCSKSGWFHLDHMHHYAHKSHVTLSPSTTAGTLPAFKTTQQVELLLQAIPMCHGEANTSGSGQSRHMETTCQLAFCPAYHERPCRTIKVPPHTTHYQASCSVGHSAVCCPRFCMTPSLHRALKATAVSSVASQHSELMPAAGCRRTTAQTQALPPWLSAVAAASLRQPDAHV
jgi:hypothetical protein